MVDAKQAYKHKEGGQSVDVEAEWDRFEKRHYAKKASSNRWMHIAAIFLAGVFISGMLFAAFYMASPEKKKKVETVEILKSDKKMLTAFIVNKDDGSIISKRGDAILVAWCKGAWIEFNNSSFVEEHKETPMPYMFHVKNHTIRLNGKVLDVHNLPDVQASALRKMTVRPDGNRYIVDITTMPVEVPKNIKGNINPELTILLTGKVPEGHTVKSTIYVKSGINDSFNWKDYQYTTWAGSYDNISNKLEEVAIRVDHHVRINIGRDVTQNHIDRIKRLLAEKGIKNYEFVRQNE
jgi:hypothetical protein